MNILMIGLDLNPPWVEGVRNTTYELSLGLRDRGHDVHFLTKGYAFHKRTEHLPSGITIHRILTREKQGYLSGFPIFISGLPRALSRIAKERDINVIHAHSSYPFFGWYVGVVSALCSCKRIFSLYSHSTSPPAFEYSPFLMHALRLAKSSRVLKLTNTDSIIVNSRRACIGLISTGFCEKKIHYVPIGVDTTRFKPKRIDKTRMKDELSIPKEARVILFAGDLTPDKGVETFLHTLEGLKAEGEEIVGLVLTKGLYEKESSRRQLINNLVSRFNLGENVRFLGIRHDIETIYNMSDVVVFPFLQNYALMDTPRALLEAMACGKPVVATSVGTISEIIKNGRNGFLVEPNNELALNEAIRLLLQDNEMNERLGRNAASFIQENHKLSTMISRVEEVYELND